MNKIVKVIKYLLNSDFRFLVKARRGKYNYLSDEEYLLRYFIAATGKELNLIKPKTFNEKMQWLKLYNRNDVQTIMVDKYAVKKYVADKIGEEYIIRTLGVWDRFDDINFDTLPNQFVLKCTHDSGGLVVCREKNNLDIVQAEYKIKKSLNRNYYYWSREWPYKNVQPRILAEYYVQDGDNPYLPVYKFLCFNGEPQIIQTIQNDKQPNESIDYFDKDWNLLDLRQNFPNSLNPYKKPKQLNDMLNIARILSEGIPFVRIDLYLVNGKIKFSEFTFFSDGGLASFEPSEWGDILGDLIVLPPKSNID